ncbi:hypothetical protein BDV09DRAFT_81823 [Aspergillus tetrazonus]
MPWLCFPSQEGPSNRNLNPRPHIQSGRGDHTDAEPPKIGLLTLPWNQVQKPVAAKICSPHRDLVSCQTSFEIVRITGAGPPYEGQLSQLEQAEITTLGVSPSGTTSRVLRYGQVRSLPGGPEALTEFLNSYPVRLHTKDTDGSTTRLVSHNPTRPLSPEPGRPPHTNHPLPSGPHLKRPGWQGWFLRAPILAPLIRHLSTKD